MKYAVQTETQRRSWGLFHEDLWRGGLGTNRARLLVKHVVVGDEARCVRVAVLDQLCKGAVLSLLVECKLLGVLLDKALSVMTKSLKLAPLNSQKFAAVNMPISLRVEMSRFFDIENCEVSSFMFSFLSEFLSGHVLRQELFLHVVIKGVCRFPKHLRHIAAYHLSCLLCAI